MQALLSSDRQRRSAADQSPSQATTAKTPTARRSHRGHREPALPSGRVHGPNPERSGSIHGQCPSDTTSLWAQDVPSLDPCSASTQKDRMRLTAPESTPHHRCHARWAPCPTPPQRLCRPTTRPATCRCRTGCESGHRRPALSWPSCPSPACWLRRESRTLRPDNAWPTHCPRQEQRLPTVSNPMSREHRQVVLDSPSPQTGRQRTAHPDPRCGRCPVQRRSTWQSPR